MKIGIDCRLWGQPVGVGRYVRNLVSNLVHLDKKNEYILFAKFQDQNEIESVIHNTKFIIRKADISWHGLREQIELPKILNTHDLDLMHFPYFSIPFFYYKPFIVTVHDLIINRFNTGRASTLPYPLYLIKRLGYHAVLSNAVYRAKKIIVPSSAVKTDLLKTYSNINPDKVEVTYEGGFEDNLKSSILNLKSKIEGEYFIRVGNYYPHKNVENLLFAFKMLINDYKTRNTKLVLVGRKDFFFKRIENLVSKLDLKENVIFLDNVSDEELTGLYRNAIATVVPSFMEGFSLTSVEALSVGSIVLASDIPVHREVCNGSAIYFNSNDPDEIRKRMEEVFKLSQASRDKLVREGKKRATQFSWKKMAFQTLKIYDSINS